MRRSRFRRAVAFALMVVVVLGISLWLNGLQPPPSGKATSYDTLQNEAVSQLEDLSEKGFTVAVAVVAALAAAALGLTKEKPRFGVRSSAMTVAIVACVVSSLSGVILRLRVVEMVSNEVQPYLFNRVIQLPLQVQYYSLIIALFTVGWMIIDNRIEDQR